MLGFQLVTSTTLGNISALTNQGFFHSFFWLDCLVQLEVISEREFQVLSQSDDVASWANFVQLSITLHCFI